MDDFINEQSTEEVQSGVSGKKWAEEETKVLKNLVIEFTELSADMRKTTQKS